MKEQLPDWNKELRAAPFVRPRFTAELEQKIVERTKRQRHGFKPSWLLAASASILLMLGGFAAWYSMNALDQEELAVRHEYQEAGRTLFTIFPDPMLTAGEPYGYIVHFTAPFEQFKGKQLEVRAVHEETGMLVSAGQPQTIHEPSPGYDSLERFTFTLGLPFSGKWHYEILLDNKRYGNAIVTVAEPSWETSTTFNLPYTGNNGQEHHQVLTGEDGKLGFIGAHPFVAGEPNKYLWHLWTKGLTDAYKNFQVLAVKRGSEELIQVCDSSLGSGLHGSSYTTVCSMSLPDSGIWRLLAYADGQLLGSIVVEADTPAGIADEGLFRLRTPYIGSSGAVGDILYELPGSEHLQRMMLHTTEAPYGLTAVYDDHLAPMTVDQINEMIIYNSTFLLALIDNAEWVTIRFNTSDTTITLEQLEQWYGWDVKSFTREPDLQSLVQSSLEDRERTAQFVESVRE